MVSMMSILRRVMMGCTPEIIHCLAFPVHVLIAISRIVLPYTCHGAMDFTAAQLLRTIFERS
jgi:hypothetical protein